MPGVARIGPYITESMQSQSLSHKTSIQFSSVSHTYLPSTNCGLVQLLVLIFPVEGVALCPCYSPTS